MKLEIFDFDGTIVYSPNRNTVIVVNGLGEGKAVDIYDQWLKKNNRPKRKWNGWFGRKETLLHPIFPRPVKENMLNKEIADLFVKSKSNNSVFTWLMTGRHTGIGKQVIDILKEYQLLEDHEINTESFKTLFATKTPTLDWKKETIADFVLDNSIEEVEMWEDRPEHVKAFVEFGQTDLKYLNCSLKVNFVS